MSGDWYITVTGTVARILKEDVDKSGRNPKYFITFVLRPDSIVEPSRGVSLRDEIHFRIKEREYRALSEAVLVPGDFVTMTGRGNGPTPNSFYLTSLRKLTMDD